MIKKILVCLLFAGVIFNLNAQRKEYYFRFFESDKQIINNLITKIISIDNVKGDTIYAYANPKEFEKFKTLGYLIEELPHPSSLTKVAMATTVAQMANWDKYPTYPVYRQLMKNFQTNYPDLCKLDSFGVTNEGRKLYVVKISDNVNSIEEEPEFFYTSSMHGDETTGFVLMLRMIDYLLTNYGTNARITNLVNNYAIYINPAANPDGTYSPSDVNIDGATRSNANGVDINRNFPDPKGGQHPDGNSWQIETQAFMDFASAHHFVMSANFHGGIELVNYPWDTWTSSQNPHADNDWFYTISRNYADSCHAFGPSGYLTGENNGVTHGGDWYVVEGGRQDFMNYFQHCREVTIELSNTKLLNPAQLPTMWNANRASFLTYIERSLYGFHGTVTNPSKQPVSARIFISGHDKDNSYVMSNPINGSYYRPINPGTYQVTYSAEGYISQTLSVSIPAISSSVIQNVMLQPAQQVNISGTITSAVNSMPIENAKIELLGTSFPAVYSNAAGFYLMTGVFENTYQIKVSKPGYAPVIQQIVVNITNFSFNFTLNESLAESFESGLPAGFTTTGAGWIIDNVNAYDGSQSLKSAAIPNSSSTSVSVQLNILTAGNISFFKKVSSESGYDKLKFYIDGVEKGNWSGDVAWSEATYAVTTGNHTFKWDYSKDGSSVSGSDCAWIDYINFPTFGVNVTFNVTSAGNPLEGATISFNQQQLTTAANGLVTFNAVPRGNNLPFTISKAGYIDNSGFITTMYQNLTTNVSMVSTQSQFTITFHITNGTTNIQGAHVSFAGSQQTTNDSGNAVFTNVDAANNLPYTVTAAGYQTANGLVNADADKTVNIILLPVAQTYTVTFIINSSNGPVSDAVVTFNNIANEAGNYVFGNISAGTYPYIITCHGYNDASGTITITDSNVEIQVVLTETVQQYTVNFRLDMSQATGFNPETDHLYISGTLNNWTAPGSNNAYLMTTTDNLIYSIQLILDAGSYQYKFYNNAGWNGAEWSGEPNRILHLSSDTTLLHHFGNLTSVCKLNNHNVIIYPNPANNILFVSSYKIISEIRILNLNGSNYYKANVNKNEYQFDISNLISGIYRVELLIDNQLIVKKLIVQ